jgi:hypothetical protein
MNTVKLLFALLLLSSWAPAQQERQPQSVSPNPDATIECAVIFSSGTGANLTKFCVTVNGNIPQFSIGGNEMIYVGQVGEGYGLCDATASTRYYDYAYTDSGNWLPPTLTQSGNIVTVTRETSDGIWQLKQTITAIAATAALPGSAKIAMALKNLSATTRSVALLRFADVDADGKITTNNFDYTAQTALGLDPEGAYSGRGLAITNDTFFNPPDSGSVAPFAQTTDNGPDPCNSFVDQASHAFTGDGSIVLLWGALVGPRKTTTFTGAYKPI